jgi:hypothetical protein
VPANRLHLTKMKRRPAQIDDASHAMSAEFNCTVRQMLQSLRYDEPVYAARLTFGQLRQEHLKSGSSGITM